MDAKGHTTKAKDLGQLNFGKKFSHVFQRNLDQTAQLLLVIAKQFKQLGLQGEPQRPARM